MNRVPGEVTVYHFFKSPTLHHTPKFIRAFHHFHLEMDSAGCFVLFSHEDRYEQEYQKLEQELGIKLIRLRSSFHMLLFFIKHYFNAASTIVLHGFSISFFLCNYLMILKKYRVLWVNWGNGQNLHQGLKGAVTRLARQLIYNQLDGINTLMSPDAEALKKDFGYKKSLTIYSYIGLLQSRVSDKELVEPFFTDDKVTVLIGNHIGELHNHVKWLNELTKFRDQNIRIVIFAGYGSSGSNVRLSRTG